MEEGYVPEHGDMNFGLGPSEWVEARALRIISVFSPREPT
jgi:hypothetical protein